MSSQKRFSRYASTPEKLMRWEKEGRGKGAGADYKPWLTVHDVPSKGLRTRVWSAKTGRIHHLLSMLEYLYFIILESDPDVLDIWEQFPLSLERTKAIAEGLGHYHPWDRSSESLVVMTTDFVYPKIVGGQRVLFARNLKYRRDLKKLRTLQKIEIEREFWREKPDVDYASVTEAEIPRDLIRNLRWLRGSLRPDYLGEVESEVPNIEAFLRPLVIQGTTPLADLTDQADSKFGLEQGSALAVAKWLMAHRLWKTDLGRRISPIAPLLVDSFHYGTAVV